ncbi:MAG: GAF domain-containing sensor histidine kinase [Syntrophorhabdaceae bacterium]
MSGKEKQPSDLIVCETALGTSERKLASILELGRIIALDLNLEEMLRQIASKAREVMEADRFNLLLYEPATDELRTKTPLEIEGREFRTSSHLGIAGHSFHTGQTINVEDAQEDPRFFRYIDEATGYTTHSMLCMPFFSRSGSPLGVMQLINKRTGTFTEEDEVLLRMFTNHVSVFIEIAQLQKARVESLERARKELERLNSAKGKALDHLSHELKTPLALTQGYLRILKRKLEKEPGNAPLLGYFDTLKRYMQRLFEVQKECERIIHAYREIDQENIVDQAEDLWRKLENLQAGIPDKINEIWPALKDFIALNAKPDDSSKSLFAVYPVMENAISDARINASHRDIEFRHAGDRDAAIVMDKVILRDMLSGLVKNAIENTPDGSLIELNVRKDRQNVAICVIDHGIGITQENKEHIFEGFFHTQDTDMYGSRSIYDFGAGGKGLDLFQMTVYAKRFGFEISMQSSRCRYLPTDSDICPGNISLCPHISGRQGCIESGMTTFCLTFPVSKEYLKIDSMLKEKV